MDFVAVVCLLLFLVLFLVGVLKVVLILDLDLVAEASDLRIDVGLLIEQVGLVGVVVIDDVVAI